MVGVGESGGRDCDTFQTSANECKHRCEKDNTARENIAFAERLIQSIFRTPLLCHSALIIFIMRDVETSSGWVVSKRWGRPPVENIKEDIFSARKVKDTLGCYPLNEKSDKTLFLIRGEGFWAAWVWLNLSWFKNTITWGRKIKMPSISSQLQHINIIW